MAPHATVAILSIGQMGLGIARLLQAHGFRILSNVSDRSDATRRRAADAEIELVDSDEQLVQSADYVLSIVPPRDALATAQRVERVLRSDEEMREGRKLWYLELNAMAPGTAKQISEVFDGLQNVRFVDGGIIGNPPVASSTAEGIAWTKPGIPLSGPNILSSAPIAGALFAQVLNTRHLDNKIGSASGLKCCFAALTKGFTALALQSFTTAVALDVFDALQDYLATYNPAGGERAHSSIVSCTSKAYRWVEEMNQIGDCFAVEGGFREQAKVFRQIANVYEGLAEMAEKQRSGELDKARSVAEFLKNELAEKGTRRDIDKNY